MTNGSGGVPRNPRLADDLAALAEKERSRQGAPPTAEQLIAFRDGKLSEDEAERIRDRLAVDPQWAAIYLDLKLKPDPEALAAEVPGGVVSDAEVDEGWRALAGKLDQDVSPVVEPELEAGFEPNRRWRYPSRMLFSMAAMLIMGLGLAWLLVDWWPDRSPEEHLPEGRYHRLLAIGDFFRNPSLAVPHGVVGLEFLIDAAEFPSPGEYRIETLDVDGVAIWREDVIVEAGQVEIPFRVPSTVLEQGKAYRLTVRRPGTSEAKTVLIFEPEFEPPSAPQSNNPGVSSVGCAEIDHGIEEAVDFRQEGERRAAERRYLEILDQARSQGCLYQEARIWNGLATLAIVEGRLTDSLPLLEKASEKEIAHGALAGRSDQDHWLKETIELNRGVAYSRLRWLDEALEALMRTDNLYRLRGGAGPKRRASFSVQVARVYRLMGNAQEARMAIREGLAAEGLSGKLTASLWQESARLDLEAGRLDAAEGSLGKAVEAMAQSNDDYARGNVFADLAELKLAQEKWREGLQWALKALELVTGADKPDIHLEAHARYLQSLAFEGLGRMDEAARASDGGLALLESLRAVWRDQGLQFFDLRQKYYRHRLDLAAADKDIEGAWTVIEGHRAQSLLDSTAVRARRPDRAKALDSRALEQKQRELLEAIRKLDEWEPAAGKAVRSVAETRFFDRRLALRELQAAERRAVGLRVPPSEIDYVEAGEMLEAETLGLVLASGKNRYYAIAVARDLEPEILPLNLDRRRIRNLLIDTLESLKPQTPHMARKSLEPRALELSHLLLAPLEEHLAKFSRLVIAAEGSLATLPLEILRHPLTSRRLVESHEVAYVPSFSVLGALRRRTGTCSQPTSELIAMGDPIFSSKDQRWPSHAVDPRNREDALALYPLPATADEAKMIASLYSNGASYVGPSATRQRLMADASVYRILHVASHARSDPRKPERSKIALSCVDTEGNVPEGCDLYFVDVLALDLCGQTVVLSACETAGGLAVEGEGVLGMPWAFLHAGASTVVASLWQVTDETTAELMKAFHGYLANGRQPAESLRLAKLDLIGAGRPAWAWAPFVVLGDWR